MTELYTFLDGAIADIRSKIDIEYKERLAAHEKKISEELSPEDYTPNYGKINVVDALSHFYEEAVTNYGRHPRNPSSPPPCKPQITKWVGTPPHATQSTEPATDTHPNGRWFISYIPVKTSYTSQGSWSAYNSGSSSIVTTYGYSITLIDNYGLTYHASCDNTSNDTLQVKLWRLDVDGVLSASVSTRASKYRLPNFLIDFCKKQTQNTFTEASLQLLAEQYYKRFVSMKPLFTSGRFTDYASLQAQKVDLEEKLAATTVKLHEATERITTLTGSLETSTTENSELKRELAATRAQLTSETALIEKMKDAAATTATLLESTTAELTEEKAQKSALRLELDTTLQTLTIAQEGLLAANKQLEELRAENQHYVDLVYQQRLEITNYKKHLIERAPVSSAPNLEELVAQAVKKALEKSSIEGTDL
jgi:hypothetical protein